MADLLDPTTFSGAVAVVVVSGFLLWLLGKVVPWHRIWKWTATRPDAAAASRQRRQQAKDRRTRQDLVEGVLLRATLLRKNVVRDVIPDGYGRWVIVNHPSGRETLWFDSHERYVHAVRHEGINPLYAKYGKLPVPVKDWPEDRLRKWLQDNASATPE